MIQQWDGPCRDDTEAKGGDTITKEKNYEEERDLFNEEK
jgi:hypothetical protein